MKDWAIALLQALAVVAMTIYGMKLLLVGW